MINLTTIILIDNVSDLNVFPKKLLQDGDVKVFSFNLETHTELQLQKIKHEMADDLLSQEQRFQLFDKMMDFRTWYLKIPSADYEFEGVNLLSIFDAQEFQSYFLSNLINFTLVKQIIQNEKPVKIFATRSLFHVVESITKQHDCKTEYFGNLVSAKLLWDTITFKYNIRGVPFSLRLSKKNYLKIKNFVEKIMGRFYGFWLDINSDKKKCIIFLEFNIQSFAKLFLALRDYDGHVVLINQRRSVIWGKDSLNIIKKSNSKVLSTQKILSKKEQIECSLLVNDYLTKIDNLWENDKICNKIFQIDGYSFWNSIKDTIVKSYSERLFSHMLLIRTIKKIFDNMDVRCIVSLNETGETEKVVLELNNKQHPSILLEHGFIERTPSTKRFDILSDYFTFKDKIAVWGEAKKEWLVNEYNIDPSRIIVTGSPRHDDYFAVRSEKNNRKEKILLLAPNPINDVNGLSSAKLKLRFNNLIKNILSIIENFNNIRLVVKLHPIQLKHNEEIKSLIRQLNKTVPIYLWTPIIDTINNVDAVVVLTPEINATPTMLLESMILGKPTMNIYIDDTIPQFEHVKNGAVLTLLDDAHLESEFQKFLFDSSFQRQLTERADKFVTTFLQNRGTASEGFASILKSY